MLKLSFEQPQALLALNMHFFKLCIEVALIFPQVGFVALLNAGTRTDDVENAEYTNHYLTIPSCHGHCWAIPSLPKLS